MMLPRSGTRWNFSSSRRYRLGPVGGSPHSTVMSTRQSSLGSTNALSSDARHGPQGKSPVGHLVTPSYLTLCGTRRSSPIFTTMLVRIKHQVPVPPSGPRQHSHIRPFFHIHLLIPTRPLSSLHPLWKLPLVHPVRPLRPEPFRGERHVSTAGAS
ncbi:hypothetical protein DENSPDRAFT_407468 [Dentipellis sp. KUC8613]|nr:hypothetical protein DENSPDRAFT_407468 [Dentipellis sp. KUC8613]